MSKHSHLLLALIALVGASLSHATITGYSNTLSSYTASATGVTSTYSFAPLSGISNAFRTIRITNQGFSAASSPLTASCSNVVSNPTASLSNAVGASQTATFSFKTSSDLKVAAMGKISLTFPSSLVTAVASSTSCELVPTPATKSVTDSAGLAANPSTNVIAIEVKADVAAGQITVTCSGLTFLARVASPVLVAATTGVLSGGISIKTSVDTEAASVGTPAIGSVVAGVNALTLSQAVGSEGTASVTFTTSTSFEAHATNNKITLTFPSGLVASQNANLCGITVPTTAITQSSFSNNQITLIVTSNLNAGVITVTCSGLNLVANAAVTASQTTTLGLRIETSQDTVPAYVSTPAVGEISGATLTMSSAAGVGGIATISFKTSSNMQQSSGNRITITFPIGSVIAQADNLCRITSSETPVTSKFTFNAITMSFVATSSLAAGPVTVTCTGLELAAKPAVTATASAGLKIETSKDTVAAYVNTPAVGAIVANAATALVMSSAVGTTGTATISFTTSTPILVADTTKTVTLTFPAGHVTAATCGISSPSTAAGTGSFATDAMTITLESGSSLAAGPVIVTCTGVALVAKPAVTATASAGLKIETSKDTVAAWVNTPAVGAISIAFVSQSAFSASLGSDKTLDISSAVDVWTGSSASVVICTVSSFTNAAVASSQSSRSLLQANQVQISALDSSNNVVGTVSSTGQTFPASVPSSPTRTLYLPKASSSFYGIASACMACSVLMFLL